MHEYDLIADWYARDRTHLTGLPEVQALANSLPPGASVLDVGCGNGIPLTRFLVEAGFNVLGVDSSSKMRTEHPLFGGARSGRPGRDDIVENAGYGMMLSVPDVVVRAIQEVVEQTRRPAP